MKYIISIVLVLLLSGYSFAVEKYEPTWESLAGHGQGDQWLQDAKLGIYFHWGVYTVPAFAFEWYPRDMNIKGSYVNKHHVEVYGEPTKFGYHDFVPMFKAEKFNAEEWVKLFEAAGAKFAGPVAEHHDGFSMWASKLTPWNSMDKGPHRDVTGELAKAIRNHDMKLITTFHHSRNCLWKNNGVWTGHYDGIIKDYPSLLDNPENAFLYGYMPREQFVKLWLGKLEEVVDNYQPDMIWFDSWLDEIPEKVRQEFCAYYFNQAQKWGREVTIIRKQNDLPLSLSINDHEKSREPKALAQLWMTDDTISTGSWCYIQNLTVKPLYKIVHSLVDTVSKNGVLLLNVSPKSDGTIPADQKKVLYGLGDWLKVNGQAIYNTRPWKLAGQGPTTEPDGGFSDASKFLSLEYSSEDIRFTQSKDGKDVYAICMGWPKKAIVLDSMQVARQLDSASVQLLGSPIKIDYAVDASGVLSINVPLLEEDEKPCDCAYTFKLTGFDLKIES